MTSFEQELSNLVYFYALHQIIRHRQVHTPLHHTSLNINGELRVNAQEVKEITPFSHRTFTPIFL